MGRSGASWRHSEPRGVDRYAGGSWMNVGGMGWYVRGIAKGMRMERRGIHGMDAILSFFRYLSILANS